MVKPDWARRGALGQLPKAGVNAVRLVQPGLDQPGGDRAGAICRPGG